MGASFEITGAWTFEPGGAAQAQEQLPPELRGTLEGDALRWEVSIPGTTLADGVASLKRFQGLEGARSGRVELQDRDTGMGLRLRPGLDPVEVRVQAPPSPLGDEQEGGWCRRLAAHGRVLATCGLFRGLRHSEVLLWDLDDGRLLARGGEGGIVGSMAWSDDGACLALGRADGRVRLWWWRDDVVRDVKVGSPRTEVWGVRFSPTGSELLAWSKKAYVIDVASGKVRAKQRKETMRSGAWLGDEVVLADDAYRKGSRVWVADRDLQEVRALDVQGRWELVGVRGAKRVVAVGPDRVEVWTRSARRRLPLARHVLVDVNRTTRLVARDFRGFYHLEAPALRSPWVGGPADVVLVDNELVVLDHDGVVVRRGFREEEAEPVSRLPQPVVAPEEVPAPRAPRHTDPWLVWATEHADELGGPPPFEPEALRAWLEERGSTTTRWTYDDTPSSVSGAELHSDGSVAFYRENKGTHQGGGGMSQSLEDFVAAGPQMRREVPASILAELWVVAWRRGLWQLP